MAKFSLGSRGVTIELDRVDKGAQTYRTGVVCADVDRWALDIEVDCSTPFSIIALSNANRTTANRTATTVAAAVTPTATSITPSAAAAAIIAASVPLGG